MQLLQPTREGSYNIWNNLIYPGQQLILPGVKPASQSIAVISYTQNEVDLLARL